MVALATTPVRLQVNDDGEWRGHSGEWWVFALDCYVLNVDEWQEGVEAEKKVTNDNAVAYGG
ncbi:Vacuolar protein sorting-associated protein 13A [Sesbania bispinosa]|nr:Vacuolar protein sorting-associated protein 13A [Sesbania bispinosa]